MTEPRLAQVPVHRPATPHAVLATVAAQLYERIIASHSTKIERLDCILFENQIGHFGMASRLRPVSLFDDNTAGPPDVAMLEFIGGLARAL